MQILESAIPEKKEKKKNLLSNWSVEHCIFQNWHLFHLKETVYGAEEDKAINGFCEAEAFNQLQKLFDASTVLHRTRYCYQEDSSRHQNLTEDAFFSSFCEGFEEMWCVSVTLWHFEIVLTSGMWLILNKWEATQSINNIGSKFLMSGEETSSSRTAMPCEQDTGMEKGKYAFVLQCLLFVLILSYFVTQNL